MPRKLGIIAGLGDLPVNVAARAIEAGRDIFIIRLGGFVEPRLEPYPGEIVGLGEVGRQIKLLRDAGCQDLVFAGIVKRPDFKALKLDMRGARLLPSVLAAARKGDDALLTVLVSVLEKEGFNVLGAEDIASGLLVTDGVIAGGQPSASALSDLKHAAKVASAIGALDIGQGCVVRDGLVIAVEAQEGTDAMLERVESLPRGEGGGVLVKRPKPMQERRIDLPTIGQKTVERAAAAGLSGIGVEAGGALIIDQDATIKAAEASGLFIYGFPKTWGDTGGDV